MFLHGEQNQYTSYFYLKRILMIVVTTAAISLYSSIPCVPLTNDAHTHRRLQANIADIDEEGCVHNVLIDKFPEDEFMPPRHDEASRQVISGTFMSEYEAQIIKRLITSIAGVFRSKKYTQHLIFTGVKNGGYLANIASLSWPIKKRGKNEKVILHLINDSDDYDSMKTSNEIMALKEKTDRDIRMHDLNSIDTLTVPSIDTMISRELDAVRQEQVSELWLPSFATRKQNLRHRKSHVLRNLSSIAKFSADVNNTVIPYFHVGGKRMDDQLNLLEGAVPLFLNQTIVTVGIEHSIDMDVDVMVKFFNAMNYKTYFLGKNHLVRIDNLCQSVLHNILARAEFQVPSSLSHEHMFGFHTAPAFYVAIAGKRFEAEARAIQHTYDMLGVYSLQPSNAQDRSRERYSSLFSSLLRGVNLDNSALLERERIYTESE